MVRWQGAIVGHTMRPGLLCGWLLGEGPAGDGIQITCIAELLSRHSNTSLDWQVPYSICWMTEIEEAFLCLVCS